MELIEIFGSAWGVVFAIVGVATLRQSARRRVPLSCMNEEATFTLHAATSEATSRGHHTVDEEHLLLSLLLEPEVASAIRAMGVDPDAIANTVDTYLATRPKDVGEVRRLEYTRSVVTLLRRAVTFQRARVGPLDLLTAMLDGPPAKARTILAKHGAQRDRVGAATLDAKSVLPSASPAAAHEKGPYRSAPEIDSAVRFWNDDRTTVEFVIESLTTIFGKPAFEARWLTLRVDRFGSAIVGRYTREEAERRTTTVLQGAKENGFPLRVTVERVGDDARAA